MNGKMNNKQKKTLKLIFSIPTPANIKWSDIESLFSSLGAIIEEGNGSRVRIKYKNIRAVFHRPHPSPDTDKATVKDIKKLLENAGIEYDI